MKLKFNKYIIIFIVIIIILTNFTNIYAVSKKQINSNINNSYKTISNSNYGSWNLIVSQMVNMKSSEFIKERLFYSNLSNFNNTNDVINKSLTVMNIKALGKDPRNYNNKNYLNELLMLSENTFIDPLDNTYMLFALSYCNYGNKKKINNLINNLLKYQSNDGGFSINNNNSSNVQFTGMVITAMSSYANKKNVNKSIKQAIDWLSNVQLEDGSFMGNSKKSGKSTIWAIMGLISNKVSINDKRFVKKNKNLYEILNIYRQENGEYVDYIGDSGSGNITEQAILTLTTIKNQKSPFFNNMALFENIILILIFLNVIVLFFIFYKKVKGEKINAEI